MICMADTARSRFCLQTLPSGQAFLPSATQRGLGPPLVCTLPRARAPCSAHCYPPSHDLALESQSCMAKMISVTSNAGATTRPPCSKS